jgi:hypothetical protein
MNKATLPVEVRKARTPKQRIPANQMLVVNQKIAKEQLLDMESTMSSDDPFVHILTFKAHSGPVVQLQST